tara:strand:- start:10945 stop:11865 length:921 start_codon:yes stop_codon:yes gene_type:complete
MKFISFHEKSGQTLTGVVLNNNDVYVLNKIYSGTILDLILDRKINDPNFHEFILSSLKKLSKSEYSFGELQKAEKGEEYGLLIPYSPPEVWGCGVTYKRNMQLHEEDIKKSNGYSGLYSYVYESERPEIFFKGLAHHCVGPNDDFSIRDDSEETFIEAELAIIFDSNAEILGYTAANDITAWDIEKECPLFLNQGKIFKGSCVLGPSIVPERFIKDPLNLNVSCELIRDKKTIYTGEGSTKNMVRTFKEFRKYLFRNNIISLGALFCTGTAIGIPNDMFIKDGDKTIIEVEGIGIIKNSAKKLKIK